MAQSIDIDSLLGPASRVASARTDLEALLGPSRGKAISGPYTNGKEFPGRRPMAGDPYGGASRFDRDLTMWGPVNRSADLEVLTNKTLADARAKDISRNDSLVANTAGIHKDSIVGSMYMLNAKPNRQVLGLTAAKYDPWEIEFQEEVESLFTLAVENNNCWLDASRSLPFTGQVRLAVGIFTLVGEYLATAEWNKDKTRPFKTMMNCIDVDRLMTPFGEPEGPNLRRGIYRDQYGAPTAFSICDGYPADPLSMMTGFNFTKVPTRTPWGREQVIYLKDPLRADQTRGISAMVTMLKEWKMTKAFRDITLQNAVVNATFAASLESEFPEAAFAAIGAQGTDGTVGSMVSDYAGAYLSTLDEYTAGRGSALMLDGVKIPHLFPGLKLQMRPAGSPGGVGSPFEDSLLRYLSAGLGVSYEQFSKNYSNTNYSSIRAALIDTWKGMQARKRLVADRFATSCYRLWFEEMWNARAFSTITPSMPSIYLGMNLDAYTQCEWLGAGRGMIDELKETQAAAMAVTSNLTTLEAECGKRGLDWRQVIRQRAREEKLLKLVGLPPTSPMQNMKNATSGSPHGADNQDDQSNGNQSSQDN